MDLAEARGQPWLERLIEEADTRLLAMETELRAKEGIAEALRQIDPPLTVASSFPLPKLQRSLER